MTTTVRQGRNLNLLIAVVRDGRPRWQIADSARVSATTLSGCITGRVMPSESVQSRLAAALGLPVADLFGPDAYVVES